jgi:dolichol-phosphate mannosyltransferase
MTGRPWVILPTYNEAENLEPLVRALIDHEPELRVLVVDDASPDGTGLLADDLAEELDGVEVLHRPAKAGLGRAYVAGFTYALESGAAHVLEMDADGSHDPADVPRLLERAREDGVDVVLGSRYAPGGRVVAWSVPRRLVSRGGCAYARHVLGVPVRDLTGGFKCFSAAALTAIEFASVRSQGYAFQVELTHRALRRGLRVEEVPIAFHDRRSGDSKMSARIAVEAAWLVPALRFGGGRWRPAAAPAALPAEAAPAAAAAPEATVG